MAKIVSTHLTKIFMAIFVLAERLPTSAIMAPNHQKIHQSPVHKQVGDYNMRIDKLQFACVVNNLQLPYECDH